MRIDKAGNVGINNASPGAKVDIQTSGTGVVGQIIKATAAQTADLLRITDSSDAILVVVDSAGKVGIGTTPTQSLHIAGGNILLDNNQAIRWKDAGGTERGVLSVSAGDNLVFGSGSLDDVSFYVGTLGEAVRIKEVTGNVGIGMTGPNEKLQVADAIAISNSTEGNTARLTTRTTHETHTLTLGTTSDTTTISIPSGARLLGVSMNVNTAVTDDAGDNTWSAAFITGSTTTIVSGAAETQNTKVDTIIPDDEVTSDVTQIQFTPNAGSFSAGVIEIVAYYEELTSLANV